MPNRIIREGWVESDAVNHLDAHAERFFLRLLLRADDFGRYHANPILLKSNLFPLRDDVRSADISRWLAACEKAGLVRCYEVADKRYLEIAKFDQRTRAKTSKFPPPDGHMSVTCPSHVGHPRTETETETETDRDINIARARAIAAPGLPEVKEAAQRAAIPEDHALAFWNAVEARPLTPEGGWTDHRGQPMRMDRWQNALAAYSASMKRSAAQRQIGYGNRGNAVAKTAKQSKYVNEF